MDGSLSPQRSYLFLQGLASRFFAELGRELARRGHTVRRINFNGGDRLFWPLPGAVDFGGDLAAWPGFLEAKLAEWACTDMVLFGDCRPLHLEARRLAAKFGVRVHVAEEGYLRPNWVTLELDGVNGHSGLPHDPAWFRRAAEDCPAWTGGRPVPSRFSRRAFDDVVYNLAGVLMAWRYPGYRRHRPWHPFVEYAGWLRRFAARPAAKRRCRLAEAELAGSDRPVFLFPLQLDCDSQIRQHSPFGRLAPAFQHVIDSFARHAPPEALLVIKEHPLDNGLTDWRAMSYRLASSAGVADRVIYLEGGSLEALLTRCRGVVTVNSTVGFLALAYGVPVVTLGAAIYDIAELTYQGPLDTFWGEGAPPDPDTFDAFRRVVAHRTQVNGGFFSGEGVALAVGEAALRLEAFPPGVAPRDGEARTANRRAKRFEPSAAPPMTV